MTKSLFITSSQVTAICKGAQKAGFVAEIEIGDVLIRLMPTDCLASKFQDPTQVKGYKRPVL